MLVRGVGWGVWGGGRGVTRSRTHKYTCRTVSTGTCIGLLIHVEKNFVIVTNQFSMAEKVYGEWGRVAGAGG